MLREFENIEIMKSKNTRSNGVFTAFWSSEFSDVLADNDEKREMVLYRALRSSSSVGEVSEVVAHFWYSFTQAQPFSYLRKRKGLRLLKEALGQFGFRLGMFPIFLKHEVGHQDKESDIRSLSLLIIASLRRL